MRLIRIIGALLGLLLVLVVGLSSATYFYAREQLEKPLLIPQEGMLYWLKPGTSLSGMVRELNRKGVIDNPLPLLIWLRLNPAQQKLVAGEYFVPAESSTRDLLKQLSQGKVKTYNVTLIEGMTAAQAIQAIHRAGLTPALALLNTDDLRKELGLGRFRSLEGLFFPDTYQFERGMTDKQVLLRAHDRLQKILAEEWAQRQDGLPFESSYEGLILASIVEKETSVNAEKPQVAGVLIRRLQRGMRLEADPTTIYGLGAAFDGNLRRHHLADTDNPYNTYRIPALPPTPIALVSRSSIRAVFNPHSSDHLFFVAKGDGTHFFSSTLTEHRRAVRRYQLRKK